MPIGRVSARRSAAVPGARFGRLRRRAWIGLRRADVGVVDPADATVGDASDLGPVRARRDLLQLGATGELLEDFVTRAGAGAQLQHAGNDAIGAHVGCLSKLTGIGKPATTAVLRFRCNTAVK